MDMENFIVHVKANDVHADLEENVEARFDARN